MRDMVPRDDRSIRNIPISPAHRRPISRHEDELEPAGQGRSERPHRRRGSKKILWLGIAVVFTAGVGGLLLSTLFAGATVTVYPREEQVTAPSSLEAMLNAPVGSLSYEVMTVTRSASTTVEATGTKQVSRSASGTITIYNLFSEEPQRLIANTRFEAPDGKIYRIKESVVVPGMKGAAPGSVSAVVFADTPGASYNRDVTRFTIPGFKGDPRYEKFYAESASISGGYAGPEPTVAPQDLARAREALQQGLAQAAQSTLGAQIPAGYVPVPGTIQMTYSDISQSPGTGSTAVIGQSATMSAAIISAEALAHAIAKHTVSGYSGEPVYVKDVTALVLSAATSTKLSEERITVELKGTPTLVWRYDSEKLIDSLLGKKKWEFETIIEAFAPAIIRAEAKLTPFWDSSFPAERDKIKIEDGLTRSR